MAMRPTTTRPILATLAAATTLATSASCTGLEPAILGAAVSGAQAGITVLGAGRMNVFERASFEEVNAAALYAADQLDLTELNRRQDQERRRWYYFRYADWEKLEVEIVYQTPSVTKIETVVRSKDHRGLAALYLRTVNDRLIETGAFSEDDPSAAAGGPV